MRSILFAGAMGILVAVAQVIFGDAESESKDEHYYMAIFAAQDDINLPKHSHTFAIFVRTQDQAPNEDSEYSIVESHAISWLPRSKNINILNRKPEPGMNLGLAASIKLAHDQGAHVTMWGPYEVKKELFDRAAIQERRLNRGEILYKAIDARYRSDSASNCIHAVSDLDTDEGILKTGTERGEAASRAVVYHLERWIIDPKKTYPGIAKSLELDVDSIAPEQVE